MLLMLPRPCCTDWSGHSSKTVVTRALGIIQGALSWRFVNKVYVVFRECYHLFLCSLLPLRKRLVLRGLASQ